MSTAEIAQLENAGRSAMAYSPDTSEDQRYGASLLTASIAWSLGFVVLISAVLLALS